MAEPTASQFLMLSEIQDGAWQVPPEGRESAFAEGISSSRWWLLATIKSLGT